MKHTTKAYAKTRHRWETSPLCSYIARLRRGCWWPCSNLGPVPEDRQGTALTLYGNIWTKWPIASMLFT